MVNPFTVAEAEKMGLTFIEHLPQSLIGKARVQVSCKVGHVWDVQVNSLRSGTRCKKCAYKNHERPFTTLEAEKMGLKLVKGLPRSRHGEARVQVSCKVGHVWGVLVKSLRQGSRCRKCDYVNREKPFTVTEAEKMGLGFVGSVPRIHGIERVRVSCKAGHVWDAYSHNLRRGSRCQKCREHPFTADEAEKFGLRLIELLPRDGDGGARARVACKAGHVWDTRVSGLRSGRRCRKCRERPFTALEAEKMGLKFIDLLRVGAKARVRVSCKAGHVWDVQVDSLRRGTRCQKCTENPFTEAEARKAGLIFIEKLSRNPWGMAQVRVSCKAGHIWDADVSRLRGRKGNGCQKCASKNRERPFTETEARKAGLKIIERLPNSSGKLRVRVSCKVGHIWDVRVNDLRTGDRCRKCAYKNIERPFTETEADKLGLKFIRLIPRIHGMARVRVSCKVAHVCDMYVRSLRARQGCQRCSLDSSRTTREEILALALDAETTVPFGPYFVDMLVRSKTLVEYDGFSNVFLRKIRAERFRRKRALAKKLGYEFVIIRYKDVAESFVNRNGRWTFYAPHVVQELLEDAIG